MSYLSNKSSFPGLKVVISSASSVPSSVMIDERSAVILNDDFKNPNPMSPPRPESAEVEARVCHCSARAAHLQD